MADVVYAVDSAQIMMPDETMVLIRRGEPWAADAAVVRFKPKLFSADPEEWIRATPSAIGADGEPLTPESASEQMTASPGERRSVRRG